MIATRELPRLTPQEYFEWEVQQTLRYEYFNGQVFAMTGGSLPNADIALNMATVLRSHLQGRCKVRTSDAKVGISEMAPLPIPMSASPVTIAIAPPSNSPVIPA